VVYASLDPADVARKIREAKDRAVSSDTRNYVEQFNWSAVADDYASAIRENCS